MTARRSMARISGPVGQILYDVAHVLESAQDAERRVRRVLDLLGRLVPYRHCALLVAGSSWQPRFLFQPEPGEREQAGVRARLEGLLELLDDRAGADLANLWPGGNGPTPWRSHLAVPLIGLDRVLGVLAVGHDTPDAYSDEELSLLSAVASQLGAYLSGLQAREREHAEAGESARARDARAHQWAVVAELGQLALAGIDLQPLMDEVVARLVQCLGVEYAEVLELLPDGKALLLRAGIGWREGLIGRTTVGTGAESQAGYTLLASEPVVVDDLGTETRFTAPPLLHDHGVVSGITVVIPGRKRPFGILGGFAARKRSFTPDEASFLRAVASILSTAVERRLGEEQEHFLARVSESLAGSIDYPTTLASVTQLAVPYMGDWCVVDIVADEGGVQRLAAAHVDPARVELVRELQRRYPFDPQAPYGVARVLRTGEPELYPDIPDGLIETLARDGEQLRMLGELGHTSAIVVPLLARGRTLGAISLVTAESGRHYDATDLALAQELAHRGAVAIDNARLHGELQSQMEIHLGLNEDLRQLAEERDALRRAAQERVTVLEELDRIKGEFIATASHDLKSPLTSIRGYAQLLLRRLRTPEPDLEQIAKGLDVIDRQGDAMARLLDDLLDAARIQAGAFEPRAAPCDLGACLETVLARLNPDERGRLEVRLPDAPVAGNWEQRRIEQVLANLVGNALKYSPDSEPVSVVVERGLDEIEVAVNDRGMGIPPRELSRLFQRFHRTPQARASGLTGTGLGLYISRGIVEGHRGRIWAASAGEGQGATFRFVLPIGPPEPGAPGHTEGKEGP
jgi:signal transduction histidine kinase